MNNFIFVNPTKIYFGKDQLQSLGAEVARFGKKVLFAYGGGSIKRIGLYDRVVAQLAAAGLTVFELPGVEPNPRHTTVNKGAEICKREGVDVLLAVGGGSTIDACKAIAATAKYEGTDSWDLMTGKASVTDTLPIVTVLTLAATGSEMDGGCVISNVGTNDKLGIFFPNAHPRVSFLDPTNTFTVSPYQTASGSVDIMSHIFDVAYFSREDEMDMLRRIQEEVLSTVVKFAPVAVKDGNDYEARANLMWAASWALNGFLFDGIVQDAACHAIEHELSAFYDITHGHGLAILTPRWLTYVLSDETAPLIKRFGERVMGVDPSLGPMEGAKAAIAALEEFFFGTLGLKSRLSDLGIDDTHFATMAKKACGEKGTLDSFTTLTPADVEAIFRMCL
ncbi:MAG: iron-containing alcohol dehydrogenase [Thermoguttaceae bacterium]|nr:iron-containing alcohol dehydrogenase [Thermoguttaceae bacterium]MBR0193188.1 iron-containing alcohol dehydrogenase [Thermoguttaceae bacterium]